MSELIRIEARCNERYKTIDLRPIENSELSWRAKGLHTYLISRPPGWKLWYKDLEQRSTEGKAAIGTAVKELQEAGYLRIERLVDDKKRVVGSRWIVAQSPELMPAEGEPYTDPPDTGEPYPGNPDTGGPDTGNPLRSKKQVLPENISTTYQHTTPPVPKPAVFCDGTTYSAAFEEAWAVWRSLGRTDNKQGAGKAWNTTLRTKMNGNAPEAAAATLLQAARNFGEAMRVEGRSPDVIMHCATFFGRYQRWCDYEHWTPPTANAPAGGVVVSDVARRAGAYDMTELEAARLEARVRGAGQEERIARLRELEAKDVTA